MATTRIWKVEYRLDHVIEYIENGNKTKDKRLVTGINCTEINAYQEMMIAKKQFNKTGGILGYHAYQSFNGYEVLPEVAHEIGVKLAEELWGDRFQVIVTTHTNTKNIHNHFCINSVSFVDGKKYYDSKKSYSFMRRISDELCEDYGLKVLRTNKFYYETSQRYLRNNEYLINVKDDIDFAIMQANNYNGFEEILRKMKYEVFNRNGVLSIRKEPYKRNVRVQRTFGEEYTKNKIIDKIHSTKSVKVPFPEVHSLVGRYNTRTKIPVNVRKKATGIRALYLYYCYLLKVFPKKQEIHYLSKEMRKELQKMEEYSNEARFLGKNKITILDELKEYKSIAIKELNEFKSIRENLWRKNKIAKTEDEKVAIYSEIQKLTKKIDNLNIDIHFCKNIEIRSLKIKQELKTMKERENLRVQSKERNKDRIR